MEKSKSRLLVLGACGILVLLFVAYQLSTQVKKPGPSLPYYSFDFEKNKIEKTKEPGQKIGVFAFINQLGQPFTQEQVKNTVYVADYFFVQCPGICKQMSSELQRVDSAFANEPNVKILSHTSKPEEDTVEALMNYAKMYGVKDNNKWVFLTGDKKELYKVARNQYFIVDEEGDGGEDDFIHTERFVLIDKQGYIRGYYDGTDTQEVNRMMGDMRDMLKD